MSQVHNVTHVPVHSPLSEVWLPYSCASGRVTYWGGRRGRERPLARSFIVSTMNSGNRHRVWAWLLCALLFWLTANPPHCDLCDGVSFTVGSAQQSILKHSHPVVPDNCNGICTCCGFYGLPNVEQGLVPLSAVLADVVPESTRPAFVPGSAIFRPPRVT